MVLRIYGVADIHGRSGRLDMILKNLKHYRPDVLVVAGDVTGYFRPEPIFEFLNSMAVPVLVVRGNTDPLRVERLLAKWDNVRSLHLRRLEFKGAKFVGLSGTIPVPFDSRIGLRDGSLVKRLNPIMVPDAVFVTHPPPRGAMDEVMGRFHAGARSVARIVECYRPKLLLCGHIHERAGVGRYLETMVVNCSLGRGGGGAVIDFAAGREPRAEMVPAG
jgi:hypothetical protein